MLEVHEKETHENYPRIGELEVEGWEGVGMMKSFGGKTPILHLIERAIGNGGEGEAIKFVQIQRLFNLFVPLLRRARLTPFKIVKTPKPVVLWFERKAPMDNNLSLGRPNDVHILDYAIKLPNLEGARVYLFFYGVDQKYRPGVAMVNENSEGNSVLFSDVSGIPFHRTVQHIFIPDKFYAKLRFLARNLPLIPLNDLRSFKLFKDKYQEFLNVLSYLYFEFKHPKDEDILRNPNFFKVFDSNGLYAHETTTPDEDVIILVQNRGLSTRVPKAGVGFRVDLRGDVYLHSIHLLGGYNLDLVKQEYPKFKIEPEEKIGKLSMEIAERMVEKASCIITSLSKFKKKPLEKIARSYFSRASVESFKNDSISIHLDPDYKSKLIVIHGKESLDYEISLMLTGLKKLDDRVGDEIKNALINHPDYNKFTFLKNKNNMVDIQASQHYISMSLLPRPYAIKISPEACKKSPSLYVEAYVGPPVEFFLGAIEPLVKNRTIQFLGSL